MNKSAKKFCYDVVILGGGPAGAATALSLRTHAPSLSVALIEQSHYEAIRIGETLPPIVQPFLEHLGVWPAFLKDGHIPAYGTGAAWGSDKLLDNEFIFHASGRGWHLDRRRFDALLARQAASRNVALYTGSKLTASSLSGHGRWRLKVQSESGVENSLEAAFVVDATGRRAVLASQQNVRKVFLDRLLGVCVFFSLNGRKPLTETYTLVEAFEEGWWYTALVPEGKLAVVCMSDADIVKKHHLHSSATWLELLNETRHMKARLKEAEPLNAPVVHAAYSQRLEKMTGRAWLAVGDAATTFDPLSSQGVCKALRSGIMASYAIGDYFKGSHSSLDKYEDIMNGEFEAYLGTRADYYRRERRWEHSPFWQRRYNQITLEPKQMLRLNETAHKAFALEKLSMHLPVAELKYLCQICHIPRSAQDIVSEFKARTGLTRDLRIILALQYLIEEGVIKSAAR